MRSGREKKVKCRVSEGLVKVKIIVTLKYRKLRNNDSDKKDILYIYISHMRVYCIYIFIQK